MFAHNIQIHKMCAACALQQPSYIKIRSNSGFITNYVFGAYIFFSQDAMYIFMGCLTWNTHTNHGDERRQLSVYALISIASKLDTIILAFLCRVFFSLCFDAIVCNYAREIWNRREGFHIDFSSFEWQLKLKPQNTHSWDNNEWSSSPWNGKNSVRCQNASDSRWYLSRHR